MKKWTVMNSMKNGQAPGPGDIVVEIIKYTWGSLLEHYLSYLTNRCHSGNNGKQGSRSYQQL